MIISAGRAHGFDSLRGRPLLCHLAGMKQAANMNPGCVLGDAD
jgi:hypothetical protein